MFVDLVDGHVTLIDRNELDVVRILDRVPDEFAGVILSEPAAECVVPPQIGVDSVIHGRNVTLPRNFTAGDDLSREVQSGGVTLGVVTQVLALHIANRHRTHRRVARLFLRRGGRVPGRHRTGTQRPFIKCANSYFTDAQESSSHFVSCRRRPPVAAQHTLDLTGVIHRRSDSQPTGPHTTQVYVQ